MVVKYKKAAYISAKQICEHDVKVLRAKCFIENFHRNFVTLKTLVCGFLKALIRKSNMSC